MNNKAVRMNGIEAMVDYSESEYYFSIKSASEELDAVVCEKIEEVLAGLTLDDDKPQVTVDFCIRDGEGAFAHLTVLHPSLEFGVREFYSPVTLTDAELEIMMNREIENYATQVRRTFEKLRSETHTNVHF